MAFFFIKTFHTSTNLGILSIVVIVQVFFRQPYCWASVVSTSVLCPEGTISNQMSWSSSLPTFPPLFSDVSWALCMGVMLQMRQSGLSVSQALPLHFAQLWVTVIVYVLIPPWHFHIYGHLAYFWWGCIYPFYKTGPIGLRIPNYHRQRQGI